MTPCQREHLLPLLSINCNFGFTSPCMEQPILASSVYCLLWRTTHQSLWWLHKSLWLFRATSNELAGIRVLRAPEHSLCIYSTIMSGTLNKFLESHQVLPCLTAFNKHSFANFILIILTFLSTITLCLSFLMFPSAFPLFTLTSPPLPFFALSMPLLSREHF